MTRDEELADLRAAVGVLQDEVRASQMSTNEWAKVVKLLLASRRKQNETVDYILQTLELLVKRGGT